MGGPRQQAGFFFGEDFTDRAPVIGWPTPLMRDLVSPEHGLPVKVGQRGEGPCGKERQPQVADGSFDASLGVTR